MVARTGMSDLISEVRSMTNAGTADYTIGQVAFWSDNEIQRILDSHRVNLTRHELTPVEKYEGAGTLVYKEYYADYNNLESGTDVFELELATGATDGTASYAMDYTLGVATFTADQGGTAHFMTARSYNLNAAAAEIWKKKAGQVASLISFRTDKHQIDRSQIRAGYLEMAAYYEALSAPNTVTIERGDLL